MGVKVDYTQEELAEARRQVDSTLHKLRETLRTLEAKENASRLKPQITLAWRRIAAFEVASGLIGRELECAEGGPAGPAARRCGAADGAARAGAGGGGVGC